VKINSHNVIYDALEKGVADGLAYSISRWYKHRDTDAAEDLLRTTEFQVHVREYIMGSIMENLDQVIIWDNQEDLTRADSVPDAD